MFKEFAIKFKDLLTKTPLIIIYPLFQEWTRHFQSRHHLDIFCSHSIVLGLVMKFIRPTIFLDLVYKPNFLEAYRKNIYGKKQYIRMFLYLQILKIQYFQVSESSQQLLESSKFAAENRLSLEQVQLRKTSGRALEIDRYASYTPRTIRICCSRAARNRPHLSNRSIYTYNHLRAQLTCPSVKPFQSLYTIYSVARVVVLFWGVALNRPGDRPISSSSSSRRCLGDFYYCRLSCCVAHCWT